MSAKRIYVASSWRNERQPEVVDTLRDAGHEVYDFRNPTDGDHGFSWAQIDGRPKHLAAKGTDWVPAADYQRMVSHELAAEGFAKDLAAMKWADTFVMVLPCGKSAHLELGWACGQGKRTAILLEDPVEPELMYLTADVMSPSLWAIEQWLVSPSSVEGE